MLARVRHINDGPLYLLGAFTSSYSYFARKGHKLADTYVATLLITE